MRLSVVAREVHVRPRLLIGYVLPRVILFRDEELERAGKHDLIAAIDEIFCYIPCGNAICRFVLMGILI
jgi:hypothetical protein